MKTTTSLLVLLLLATTAGAQKIASSDVPEPARKSVNKLYPTLTTDWTRAGDNYQAFVKRGKLEKTLIVTSAGHVLETREKAVMKDLPRSARSYMEAHYAGKHDVQIVRVTDASGVASYEAETGGNKIYFGPQGEFVRSVSGEESGKGMGN